MPRTARRLTVGAVLAAGLTAGCLVPTLPAVAAKPTAAPQYESGELMNYAVNATQANRGQTLKVERAVEAAGGTVIESYAEIGVVIAQSDNANFAEALREERSVESVGATRTAEIAETDPTYRVSDPLAPGESGNHPNGRSFAGDDALDDESQLEEVEQVIPDPREAEQWDMAAIGAFDAHEVTEGDDDVLVAVLDSGIDGDHPDLAANIDQAASASCLSGVVDSSYESWQPTTSSHGTHVAGTIAADRNGLGIVGVAPGVSLSAVKVVNDDGYIFPEAAICGFMHAAATGAEITNNSYYIDPWQFWCDDDADQLAVKTAIERAVAYTQDQGVVSVAAAGNSSIDLANKTTDGSSPNDTTPVVRDISEGCHDLPAEIDGVVTVSSTTRTGELSYFSNYGQGVIDVAAPGSSILSTIDGGRYGTASGTSMASPHAAGVLALIASTHPEASGEQLVALLEAQATDTACPADGACVGTPEANGYFGEGLVDALAAVTVGR